MNKLKLSRKNRLFINILSLGFVVLGIGCTIWAVLGIMGQPDYSAEADSFTYTNHSTSSVQAAKTVESPEPAVEAAEPDPPKIGEKIGTLAIPALKLKLPIYEGTSDKQLNKGVGHFIQSVLPGEEDNSVLSGHRTTVFAKLGKLKKGDKLIVQTLTGKFTYIIKRIRIVDKNDRTVIVPTKNAVLTLSTCYPFKYIGDAPKRYILSADLVGNN